MASFFCAASAWLPSCGTTGACARATGWPGWGPIIPGQLVLLFALARIGAILLPLNFRLSPGEWDALLADCAPAHLVHDDAWAAAAQELGARRGLAVHPVATLARAG